jgi:hypothetical protein
MTALTSNILIGYDCRVDDYVGRRMMLGFAIGTDSSSFPQQLETPYDPDREVYDVKTCHNHILSILNAGSNLKISKLAYYASEFSESDPQHDGSRDTIMTLKLRLTADVAVDEETYATFIRDGCLSDDPPVIPYTMTNLLWYPETARKHVGFHFDRANLVPNNGEILIDPKGEYGGGGVTMSLIGSDEFTDAKFSDVL